MERLISPEEAIKTEVFKPGNLVWGGRLYTDEDFRKFAQTGILPAAFHGEFGFRSLSLCFAMLSNYEPPENYLCANHYGPKYSDEINDPIDLAHFSIILNREKMLSSFPNRIKAIGSIFNSFSEGGYSDEFEFDKIKKTVYGIPIEKPLKNECRPFQDEIVIRFNEEIMGLIKGITPDLWSGFVTYKSLMKSFKKRMTSAQIHLPIFSPEGDVLL